MKIEVRTRGSAQAALDIGGLGLRAGNRQPHARPVADIVNKSTDQRFRTRGAGSWPPLSDETVDRKHRAGQPETMLIGTGRLHRAVTTQTAKPVGPDEIAVGGPDMPPYARYLEHGTKDMPARKPVELTPADRTLITGLVNDHIVKGTRR